MVRKPAPLELLVNLHGIASLRCALALVWVVGTGLFAAPAWSAPISVNNPSFEILRALGLPNSCGGGCSYSQDSIPGWLNNPFAGTGLSSGQFRPGTDTGNMTYFNSLSDGPTSAYTSIGCIEQTVHVAVQPGVTYTLLTDVGWRNDASPAGMPRLRVNGIYYDGGGTPVLGGWAPFTTTYVGRVEDAGLPITICLNSVSNQGNFDNVRLSDSNSTTGVEPDGAARRPELRPLSNPFGHATRLRFSIASRSTVVLRVHDASGRVVRTLVSGAAYEAGTHEVTWDGTDDAGRNVGAGLFFMRLGTAFGDAVARVVKVR